MRCPKCNSRSMISDYDDVPGGRRRALLCVCCGKRVSVEVRKNAPVVVGHASLIKRT